MEKTLSIMKVLIAQTPIRQIIETLDVTEEQVEQVKNAMA